MAVRGHRGSCYPGAAQSSPSTRSVRPAGSPGQSVCEYVSVCVCRTWPPPVCHGASCVHVMWYLVPLGRHEFVMWPHVRYMAVCSPRVCACHTAPCMWLCTYASHVTTRVHLVALCMCAHTHACHVVSQATCVNDVLCSTQLCLTCIPQCHQPSAPQPRVAMGARPPCLAAPSPPPTMGSPYLDGVLGLLGSQAPLWAGVRLPSCRGVWEP